MNDFVYADSPNFLQQTGSDSLGEMHCRHNIDLRHLALLNIRACTLNEQFSLCRQF